MKSVFADTFYWVELINKSDSWHQRVRNYSGNLSNIETITTEEILTETINFFASFPRLNFLDLFLTNEAQFLLPESVK
jgi:hypothetical protein